MEDHFTTISIRNASSQDAEEIVDILNSSFDPNDEQRILGTNATISLVKLLIKQHDTLFFIAEEQNDIVGYIWGQTKKLSLLKSLFNTPLLLLKFCFSCIAHNKLISILKYILKQKQGIYRSIPLPHLVSFGVKSTYKSAGFLLLSKAEKYLKSKNKNKCFLLTAANNKTTQYFYKKNGYKKYKSNDLSVILCKELS